MSKTEIKTGDIERRFVPLPSGRVEVRAEDDGPRGIGGTAAVFGSETDIGPFTEEIDARAFDGVLDGDTRGLFNHNPDFVLGRTKSGTMELRVGKDGLEYDIPDMPQSRADVMEAIERGDVDGNSFAFSVAEESWIEEDEERDKPHRVIRRIGTLYDVGPVTFPAYEDTVVSARSLERASAETREEPTEDPPEPVTEPDPEPTPAEDLRDKVTRLRKARLDMEE